MWLNFLLGIDGLTEPDVKRPARYRHLEKDSLQTWPIPKTQTQVLNMRPVFSGSSEALLDLKGAVHVQLSEAALAGSVPNLGPSWR
jgi:hypothetical protein